MSWVPSFAGFKAGISGTYYWNPGSAVAPPVTIGGVLGWGRDVRSYGRGFGGGLPFLRNGMTSADTLGYGTSSNVSTLIPSVTVNTSIPDENGIPLPARSKVSSIEAGVSDSIGASTSDTYTMTPQEIADYLLSHGLIGAFRVNAELLRDGFTKPHPNLNIISPAMGPQDELSPFVRSLQSGVGKIGQPTQPPVGFVGSGDQNPLGDGMAGWRSSVDSTYPRWPTAPMPPQQPAPEPGGLLGRLLEHRRIYGDY